MGDVDYAAVAPKTSAITPVPGGVGLMTIAGLLKNTPRPLPAESLILPLARLMESINQLFVRWCRLVRYCTLIMQQLLLQQCRQKSFLKK